MSKKIAWFSLVLAASFLITSGCVKEAKKLEPALKSITQEDLAEDVKILASDEFEGRFPATQGEVKTINFMEKEFQKLGLRPGNGESFFQEVPMVEITADPSMKLKIKARQKTLNFDYGSEFMAWTLRVKDEVAVKDSEMVFVGYGIVAPEYGWNDYQGLDVRGKTVVMLVNDPGFATQDTKLFEGRKMTYYGRWTYKFEEAARQGAEAALIIHETEPAAYPWGVVRNSWSGPQLSLGTEDENLSRCAYEGWLKIETARKIFESAGADLEQLKNEAKSRSFKPFSLGLKASLVVKNRVRRIKSNNVIALLPGKKRPDEYIIYMAHWDHFGLDPSLTGDQIFNGALDNATGSAALIELAEAFKKLPSPPARSIVFLAVTGEEQGLLGSSYYAAHPIFPRSKTVAAINMDALNIFGKMKDITVITWGHSELDSYIEAAASEQGRRVRPDPKPERGSFFRSDHFPLAKAGIPVLYTSFGIDHVEHGEQWTLERMDAWIKEHYHKPSDEYSPDWDLSGAVDDLQLLFKVGYRLSKETTFPEWKKESPFRAEREKQIEEESLKK